MESEGVAPSFDLFVWEAPRDLDDARAAALVESWQAAGGDPAMSPFEPTTGIGWFYRELTEHLPGLEISSDAVPRTTSVPIWVSASDEAPARVVAIRLGEATTRDVIAAVLGLAAKYDLVVLDARNRRVHFPLAELADHAGASFWPGGALQAATAGIIGAAIAIAAWVLAIPVLSGIAIVIGAFLVLMAILTFVHEGTKRLRRT
jgi:hypothetical protein